MYCTLPMLAKTQQIDIGKDKFTTGRKKGRSQQPSMTNTMIIGTNPKTRGWMEATTPLLTHTLLIQEFEHHFHIFRFKSICNNELKTLSLELQPHFLVHQHFQIQNEPPKPNSRIATS